MITIEFATRTESFSRSDTSSVITGVFYLKLNEGFFPEEGWRDIIVPVANAWLQAACSLATRDDFNTQVSFMDGPFYANLYVKGSGLIGAELIESQLRGEMIRHSGDLNSESLLRNIASVSADILGECRSRGWSDSDTIALANSLDSATRALQA